MKTKPFSHKLILNKKTVANLNQLEMKNVNGGLILPTRIGCEETMYSTCVYSFCPCGTYDVTEVSCELPQCAL